MSMHVRLKPFNGKTHLLRSYTAFGIRLLETQGWYKVDDDVAAYLKTVKQVTDDQYSAPAFDVCTEEEAHAIDESEKVQAERKKAEQAQDAPKPMRVHNVTTRAAADAGTMTTKDLPQASPPKPSPSFDEEPASFDDDMAAPAPASPKSRKK